MQHIEGNFRGAEELDLYYQGWRPDGAPRAAVALVHGFGEHSGRYGNLVNYLVPRGYGVYGFDQRGHGQSPGPRGHIRRWAEFREDVRRFIGTVMEWEPGLPVFLLGHSLGGLTALEYALRHPDGLAGVIASAPVLARPGVSPLLLALSRVVSRVRPSFSMEARLDASALSRDPAALEALTKDPLLHGRGSARLSTEMTRTIRWTQSHAGDLRVPVLLIHGTADRVTPPEATRLFYERVAFPDKQLQLLEGGYHEPHNDTDQELVLSGVLEWLERRLEPKLQ